MDLGRYFSTLFNISIALYFTYSFLHPNETSFWLVHDGFPILMLEGFFGTCVTLLIAQALGKETDMIIRTNSNPWLGMILVCGIALVFAVLLNPWLGVYFIFSIALKFYQSNSHPEMRFETSQATFSILFLIIGGAIGLFLVFSPFAWLFQEQNSEYTSYFSQSGASGSIVSNPITLVGWGVIYYLGMAAVTYFEPKMPGSMRTERLPVIK